MTADPTALAALSNGERIEALRRRVASIPARTDGSAAPAMPVEQAEARFETRPETITESATNILQVAPAFAALLPRGGLARGSVVSVDGASSVLLSLLASVTGSGKHAAIIGLPKLGLLAATEMGADLARCALIPARSSCDRRCGDIARRNGSRCSRACRSGRAAEQDACRRCPCAQ